MASREFKIFGSGTSLMRTSRLPIQQLALIGLLLRYTREIGPSTPSVYDPISIVSALHLFGRRLRRVRPVVNASIGTDDLAGLDHLLEAAQVAHDLLPRLLAEELGDGRAERTGRRLVL